MKPSRLVVYGGLLYVVFCWALNAVILKRALADIDPLALTGMRFLIMTPLALGLAALSGERLRFAWRDLPILLACAACGYGVYQYLWIIGLAHTTPFASALLGSLTPIITLSMVAIAGHERVRSGRWAGAAVALLGVAIFEGAFSGRAAVRLGDVLTLLAAIVFSLNNVLSSRLLDRYTPVSLLAITMPLGTLMILPGALPRLLHQNFSHVPPVDWLIFAFSVLFPILLTYPVWSYGITRFGAGKTSLFLFLLPLIAGGLSVLILHTPVTGYEIVGCVVCIAGMAVSQALGKVSLIGLWAQRTLPIER